jgi:hypothetical protein
MIGRSIPPVKPGPQDLFDFHSPATGSMPNAS